MKLRPIEKNIYDFPEEIRAFAAGAKLYDSSSSPEAEVIFIDKDDGYFLKSRDSLEREAALTRYFYSKGLSAEVLLYLKGEREYMLTRKLRGENCISQKYLSSPKRLCDTLAELLLKLHAEDFSDCPIEKTPFYIADAEKGYRSGRFKSFDEKITSPEDAYSIFVSGKASLKSDTLLHGDYCLPNIILQGDFLFGGFIDVGDGGVGDRHIDLFWGLWSLFHNLKTDCYTNRFIDAYGRNLIDFDRLRTVAAAESFG